MIREACIIVAMFSIAACGGSSEHEHSAHDHADMPAAAPTGHSIFHLGSKWMTHGNDEVRLNALAGKAHVIAMVYSSCEVACPRIIADMHEIKDKASIDPSELGFVLVSIDPDRDTPDHLAKFAERTGLDESAWTLLTSQDDNVRELAAVLGVRYRRVSETDFAHSNIISLINTDGEVVHQQMGLGSASDEMVSAIHSLIHGA